MCKKEFHALTLTVLLALLSSGAGQLAVAAEAEPAERSTYESFSVIFEQNVFSKDRRPRVVRAPNPRPIRTRTQTTTLSIYVLRGIAADASTANKTIFVEEQVSGDSQYAKIGSEVLGGVIKDIQLNYVLYEKDGEAKKIKVGEEFGQTSSTRMVDVSEADEVEAANAGAGGSESDSASGEESDVLKRLMEKRRRELGS